MEVLTNAMLVIMLHLIYMYQSNTLYTLNLHNVIYLLYLIEAGKKERTKEAPHLVTFLDSALVLLPLAGFSLNPFTVINRNYKYNSFH